MGKRLKKLGKAGRKRKRTRRRGRHVTRSTAPPRVQAGAGKRLITPPVGGPLLGIPERDLASGSRGVHDELHARALVLDNGLLRLALVSVDLFAVPLKLNEEIARNVSAAVDIPQDNVLIAATHTYSGPSVSETLVGGEPDGDWLAVLVAEVTNAVQEAFMSRRPARIGVGVARCPVTLNRRIRLPEGDSLTPDGAAEPDLGVVRVTDLRGGAIAILANFACQPLSAGRDSAFLISADFPGIFAERIESAFPGCVALFTNGAAADVVHRVQSDNHGERSGVYRGAILVGELLADETVRLAGRIRPQRRVSLTLEKKRIALPLDVKKAPAVRPKRGEGAYEAVSNVERQMLGGQRSNGLLDESAARYIAESRWVPAMTERLRRGKRPRQVETSLWAVSIGTLGMVSAPGEMYSISGREVRRKSPFRRTFLLGYAGDYLGYLAPRDIWEQGGWEVEEAHRFLPGPGLPLVAGTVEDTLVDHMLSLLKSVKSRVARSDTG